MPQDLITLHMHVQNITLENSEDEDRIFITW